MSQRIDDIEKIRLASRATPAAEALLHYIFKIMTILVAFSSLGFVRHIVLT
jgi:hypothetical protein